jgi:hypothetical protein
MISLGTERDATALTCILEVTSSYLDVSTGYPSLFHGVLCPSEQGDALNLPFSVFTFHSAVSILRS